MGVNSSQSSESLPSFLDWVLKSIWLQLLLLHGFLPLLLLFPLPRTLFISQPGEIKLSMTVSDKMNGYFICALLYFFCAC